MPSPRGAESVARLVTEKHPIQRGRTVNLCVFGHIAFGATISSDHKIVQELCFAWEGGYEKHILKVPIFVFSEHKGR